MRSQSTNGTDASPPSQRRCVTGHDWRLQGLVRTAKSQIEFYQCRHCLAPRRVVQGRRADAGLPR